uniref:Putative secreted protein n=1 Tax=Amblyomma americanum TaxID=6943 RepID=A0A0C9RWK2_AMBAM
MCLSPAFYFLLIWFPFTQSASTHLTLGRGYSINILDTDGGQRTVGCLYNYTDGQKTIQGIRQRQGEECIYATGTTRHKACLAAAIGGQYIVTTRLGLKKLPICSGAGLSADRTSPQCSKR